MIYYQASDGHVKKLGDNELQHWKYIKKIPVGKGFRYFYSWDEYRAFLADPAAELQKAGNQAKQEITKAGRAASQHIEKGKGRVEKSIRKDNRSRMTVGAVREANKKTELTKRTKLRALAERAKEKWNKNTAEIKKKVEKAKQWLDDRRNPLEAWKRKRIEKEKAEREMYEKKREQLAKKYKYIDKKTINGKTVYFYTQDEINAYNRKKNYIANEPDFMKSVKHSDTAFTSEEDAMLVNPKFDSFDPDYSYNCAECSAIYELRRRGYDVESNGESGLGENADKYNSAKRFDLFYENADTHRFKPTNSDADAKKQWEAEFEQYPPGSRGDISFKWKDYNSAHSIVWEKDLDGNVHFIDCQPSGHGNRVEYTMDDMISATDHSYSTKPSGIKGIFAKDQSYTNITRTDNLELKPEITKICKDSSDERPSVAVTNAKRYSLSRGGARSESYVMDEKEITTKYPNLISQKDYSKISDTSSSDDNRNIIVVPVSADDIEEEEKRKR